MPISSPAAGTDAAFSPPPGRGAGLTLDYLSRDRGPAFRRAVAEAAAALPMADAADSAPPPAAGPLFEGADALSQLRRDLLSGGTALVASPPAGPGPAEAAGPEQRTAAAPARLVPWHHDDIEGRRLGDHPATSSGGEGAETWLFGADGFGFDDLIDVVNPLQHIPVVASIYRWITGDEIEPAASLAGGALFGGPIGLAGAAVGVAVEETTGRDLGGHALAMMFGEGADQPAEAGDLAAAPAAPDMPEMPAAIPAREQVATTMPAIPRAAPVLFIPAAEPEPEAAPAGEEDTASPADAAIAAQMKLALDKYEAMMRQRAAAPPGGAGTATAGALYDGRL